MLAASLAGDSLLAANPRVEGHRNIPKEWDLTSLLQRDDTKGQKTKAEKDSR